MTIQPLKPIVRGYSQTTFRAAIIRGGRDSGSEQDILFYWLYDRSAEFLVDYTFIQ